MEKTGPILTTKEVRKHQKRLRWAKDAFPGPGKPETPKFWEGSKIIFRDFYGFLRLTNNIKTNKTKIMLNQAIFIKYKFFENI